MDFQKTTFLDDVSLIDTEAGLLSSARSVIEGLGAALSSRLDPLGEAFSRIRPPVARRASGATYTPSAVVDAMAGRIAAAYPDAVRVVDCGAGSGRFALAMSRLLPDVEVIAVESDPLACAILEANVRACATGSNVRVVEGSFLDFEPEAIEGRTLYVGNPPYVRHHGLGTEVKDWFSGACATLHLPPNKLSGLHVLFFAKIALIAKKGDAGILITSSEWMDSASGRTLRSLLAGPLGCIGVTAIDPTTRLFEDAQVSSCITEFEIGTTGGTIAIDHVGSLDELGLPTRAAFTLERAPASSVSSWTTHGESDVPDGMEPLGKRFRVHRGQVTGGNDVWIAADGTPDVPERFLIPCITKATDLISAGKVLSDSNSLKRVVTLPADLDTLSPGERTSVDLFLQWACDNGARDSYTAKSRKPWWRVGFKSAAPILCTYMGRRPPVFVRNLAGVAHVNIAHGLYPRAEMDTSVLDRVAEWLADNPVKTGGKTYGGGLRKFEPRQIERILVPTRLFDM